MIFVLPLVSCINVLVAPRLVGTGGSWFLVDIAFYGLKLFSGPIFSQSKFGGRWHNSCFI
jgi:hypothetical protein